MQVNTIPSNPFVGLRPFESTESLFFFGRGAQTGELLERLYTCRFVSVVGRSGCGKSSLIRAGLIPKLKAGFLVADRDRWVVETMKPGDRPLRNLAAAVLRVGQGEPAAEEAAERAAQVDALAEEISAAGVEALTARLAPLLEGEDANFLLLVDQFEEIFRFGARARKDDDGAEEDAAAARSRDEAADFVSIMLALSEQREVPAYVVMTMRSDFLGDCDAFHGLPEAMNRSQYLVPRLSTQQREEAISGPIRLYGQAITPRLLDLVRNDVGDKLDQLPVMQHAMMRTWENWSASAGGPVDVLAYDAAGTIRGALSDDAEQVLASLGGPDSERRRLTARIFQALTDTDSENRRIRRPAHLKQLAAITGASRDEIMEVVALFQGGGRSFLTVSRDEARGNHLIDISHESLIRQWKTLRDWVDKEAEDRALYVRIADAALRRRESEGKRGGLWDDPELQQALDWWDERAPTPAWAAQYHKKNKKRKLAAAASAEGHAEDAPYDEGDLYIYNEARNFLEESRRARDEERDEKERQRRRTLKLTRLIMLVIFVGLLLSSGLAGYAMVQKRRADAQTGVAQGNEKRALAAEAAAKEGERYQRNERMAKEAMLHSEQGRLKALEFADENAKKAVHAKEAALAQKHIAVENAKKADAAKRDAVSNATHAREAEKRAVENEQSFTHLAYANDMRVVSHAVEEDKTTDGVPGLYRYLNSDPRGLQASFLRRFEWRYLWRQYRRELAVLKGHKGNVQAVAYSPDGRTVATAGADRKLNLWDVSACRPGSDACTSVPATPSRTLEGHADSILAVAYSPDGQTVATAGADSTVRLWDATNDVARVAASAAEDGRTYSPKCDAASVEHGGIQNAAQSVVAQSVAQDKSQNSPRPAGLLRTLRHCMQVNVLAFSRDGRVLFTGDDEGKVRLWDIGAPSAEPRSFDSQEKAVHVLAVSRDGRLLATGDRYKVHVWDAATFEPKKTFDHPLGIFPALRALVFAEVKGEPRLLASWDSAYLLDLNVEGPPAPNPLEPEIEGSVLAVDDLNGDGSDDTVVAGGGDGTLGLWDIGDLSKRRVRFGKEDASAIISAGLLHGKALLVTGDMEGVTRLWDIRPKKARESESRQTEADLAHGIAFSPSGEVIATGGESGTINLLSSDGLKNLPSPQANGGTISSLAFSPDGKLIATRGNANGVSLWRTDAPEAEPTRLDGHKSNVLSLAFSADGKLLATGDAAGNVIVWTDLSAPRPRPEVSFKLGTDSGVYALAFSADGEVLATGDGSAVRLWDTRTWKGGEPYAPPVEDDSSIAGLSFPSDPANRKLLIVVDGTVRIWDTRLPPSEELTETPGETSTADKSQLSVAKLEATKVVTAVFSHDGRTIATGGQRGDVRVWDAVATEKVSVLERPPGREVVKVRLVARNELVTLSQPQETRDRTSRHNTFSIQGLAFSPDDRMLLSVGRVGQLKLWRGMTDADIEAQQRGPTVADAR